MNNPIEKPYLKRKNALNDFPCSKHVTLSGCHRGFTLIELLIVIAIIGTLAAIAIPSYLGYKYKAKVVVAITDIRMLEEQIKNYATENGQLPDNLSDLSTIGTINDPWGNPYQYMRIDGGAPAAIGKARKYMGQPPVNNDFDLYSMGADGQTNQSFKAPVSRDDIVRAYEGRFIGLVSDL